MRGRQALAVAAATLWLTACCGGEVWPVASATAPRPRPYLYSSLTVLPFHLGRQGPGDQDSLRRMQEVLDEVYGAVREELDDGPPAGRYPLWVVASTLEFQVPRSRGLGLWSEGDFKLVLEVRLVDMYSRTVSKLVMSADGFDSTGPSVNNTNCPDDEEMARAVARHLADHYRRI